MVDSIPTNKATKQGNGQFHCMAGCRKLRENATCVPSFGPLRPEQTPILAWRGGKLRQLAETVHLAACLLHPAPYLSYPLNLDQPGVFPDPFFDGNLVLCSVLRSDTWLDSWSSRSLPIDRDSRRALLVLHQYPSVRSILWCIPAFKYVDYLSDFYFGLRHGIPVVCLISHLHGSHLVLLLPLGHN